MLNTILPKIKTFMAEARCFIGLHPWVDATTMGNRVLTQVCRRPDCPRARRRLTSGAWFAWNREQVTEDQVKKLPRAERRRLISLHRRGKL